MGPVWIWEFKLKLLNIMTIKIHQFTNVFSYVTSINVTMANTSSMTISHYAESVKATESTVPFEIEGVTKHIPIIEDPIFCTVIRKKVDFTAVGPNSNRIKDIGKDIGKYNYVDSTPKTPLDLPPGFQELYKKD